MEPTTLQNEHLFLHTSSMQVNKFLEDGFERGTVSNMYGSGGCGKTSIALDVALNCVAKNQKVLYIDTEGGVSIKRVQKMLAERGIHWDDTIIANKIPKTFDDIKWTNTYKTLVRREWSNLGLNWLRVIDFNSMLDQCRKMLANKTNIYHLIVVDSVTHHYVDQIVRNRDTNTLRYVSNNLMNFVSDLEKYAAENEVCVILTSQRVSELSEELKSGKFKSMVERVEGSREYVGGKALEYPVKMTLEIIGTHGPRTIYRQKHRDCATNQKIQFTINNRGVGDFVAKR